MDAVIFVFNVYSLDSFETIKKYFQKFLSYRTNLDQVPIILVGTQGELLPRTRSSLSSESQIFAVFFCG